MSVPTAPLPTVGQPNSTEDPKVRAALAELQTILTAGVDSTNLATALLALLGVSDSSARRGKSIINGTENTNSASYTLLTTPDRVSSIVLPTDGLIFVAYQAIWNENTSGTALASIFLGSNQLTHADVNMGAALAGPAEATIQSKAAGVGRFVPLSTYPLGLASYGGEGAAVAAGPPANYTTDATTGQVVGGGIPVQMGGAGVRFYAGGVCTIFAAAGTYDVSVRFAAQLGGVVAVSKRRLWVWTMGF